MIHAELPEKEKTAEISAMPQYDNDVKELKRRVMKFLGARS